MDFVEGDSLPCQLQQAHGVVHQFHGGIDPELGIALVTGGAVIDIHGFAEDVHDVDRKASALAGALLLPVQEIERGTILEIEQDQVLFPTGGLGMGFPVLGFLGLGHQDQAGITFREERPGHGFGGRASLSAAVGAENERTGAGVFQGPRWGSLVVAPIQQGLIHGKSMLGHHGDAQPGVDRESNQSIDCFALDASFPVGDGSCEALLRCGSILRGKRLLKKN